MTPPDIPAADSSATNDRPRRIALIAPLWMSVPPSGYGGTELLVHLLADGLAERGYDVTLFASGDSRTNARLHAVVPRCLTDAMRAGGAFEYEHYINASLVDSILDGEQFDLIHAHTGYAQVPMGRLCPTPVIFTFHTVPTIDDQWVLARYPELAYTAVSNHQASRFPQPSIGSVSVIHNGIDFSAYQPSFQRNEYLAFLGRMGPQKSPLEAIRIADMAGIPLVLAGEPQNADEKAYFESKIKPLVDGLRVRYIGPVDHARKNELLRNAAALLFPIQEEEAFGLAMIEAMACGTPVLGWARASIPEIVEFGVTGYYADSSEAIGRLAHQALALDRRGIRAAAEKRFSHARMIDGYERAYARVLGRDGVARDLWAEHHTA